MNDLYKHSINEYIQSPHEQIFVNDQYWKKEFNILNNINSNKLNLGDYIQKIWKKGSNDNYLKLLHISINLYQTIEYFYTFANKNDKSCINIKNPLERECNHVKYLQFIIGKPNLSLSDNNDLYFTSFQMFYDILLIMSTFVTILEHCTYTNKKLHENDKHSYVNKRMSNFIEQNDIDFNKKIDNIKYNKKTLLVTNIFKNNKYNIKCNEIFDMMKVFLSFQYLKLCINVDFLNKNMKSELNEYNCSCKLVFDCIKILHDIDKKPEINSGALINIFKFMYLRRYLIYFIPNFGHFFEKQ